MIKRWSTVILVACCLQGCVTTSKGGIDTSVSKEEAAAHRVDAAKKYLAERRYDDAKRHLKKAQELDKNSPDVHDALALTFHSVGELELAETHYKKAISLGKGKSRYRFNYANYLFQQQNFLATAKQLEYIIDDSLYEHRGHALILLGTSQLQMLEPESARASFEKALTLSPNNRRVLRELVVLAFEAADYKAAWRYFQRFRVIGAENRKGLSAEMLLLGIHLADKLGESAARQDYARVLKNEYPESREYQSYLRDSRR